MLLIVSQAIDTVQLSVEPGFPRHSTIVSQGLGGLHPVSHPGSSPQLYRLWHLLTLCRMAKHSRLRQYADIKAWK